MMHRLGSILVVLFAAAVGIQARYILEDKVGTDTATSGWAWGKDAKAGGQAHGYENKKAGYGAHKSYASGKKPSKATGTGSTHVYRPGKEAIWTYGKTTSKNTAWGNTKGYGYISKGDTEGASSAGGAAKRDGSVWEKSGTVVKTDDSIIKTKTEGHSKGSGYNQNNAYGATKYKYVVGGSESGAGTKGGVSGGHGGVKSVRDGKVIVSKSNTYSAEHASAGSKGQGVATEHGGGAVHATGAWAKKGAAHGSGFTGSYTPEGHTVTKGHSAGKGFGVDASTKGSGSHSSKGVSAHGTSDVSAKNGQGKANHYTVSKNKEGDVATTQDISAVGGYGKAWTKGKVVAGDKGTAAWSGSGVHTKYGDAHAKQKTVAKRNPY